MIDRMIPADSTPMPFGRAAKQRPQDPQVAEDPRQRRLDVVAENRREHEQAPHAVDDRRNRRQQLDRGAERPLEDDRAHLGEEQRDAEAHRHADGERDRRGHQRAVDRRQRAEVHRHRIPGVGDEKAESELLECRDRSPRQRADDPDQREQDDEREEHRRALEQQVLPRRGPPSAGQADRAPAGRARQSRRASLAEREWRYPTSYLLRGA